MLGGQVGDASVDQVHLGPPIQGASIASAISSIGCFGVKPASPWTWLRQEKPGATRVASGVGGDGGEDHAVRQGRAHVVMPEFVAERAGHPAAARVELADLQPLDPPQGRHRAGRADERLLLAMPVQEDAARPGSGRAARARAPGRRRTTRRASPPRRRGRRRGRGGSRGIRRRASAGSSARCRGSASRAGRGRRAGRRSPSPVSCRAAGAPSRSPAGRSTAAPPARRGSRTLRAP